MDTHLSPKNTAIHIYHCWDQGMRLIKQLSLTILLLATFSTYAVAPNHTGNLKIFISLSSSPKYLHTWVSTPPESGAPIPRLRQVNPEVPAYAAFIVSGISANSKNQFSYSVSWRLLGPSGREVYSYPDYAHGKEQLHIRPAFYMADPALDIIMEHKDPAGKYILEAVAKDNVTGKKAKHSYEFNLTK